MNAFIATAEQILIDRVLSNKAPITGKTKAGFSMLALSGFMLAAGLAFIIYAAYIWLTSNYSPHIAAAIAGGISLFCALATALCAIICLKYKQKRIQALKKEITDALQDVLDLAGDEISEPIRQNPKTAALLATFSGYLVSEKAF